MYEVILALDWSKSNMAIARLDKDRDTPRVFERPTDIAYLKKYISNIKESKSVTIEETSSAHYLYSELVELVDEVIVVDPYRNRLLLDGPKNDKRDAANLAMLTRSKNLMKLVHHEISENYEIRKLVSAYEDLIKASVRAKNQLSAYESNNKKGKPIDSFVIKQKKEMISCTDNLRKEYEKKFAELAKNHKDIKRIAKIDGIGIKSAIKIAGIILDAKRFSNYRKFLAYCGLVKYRKVSGDRDYGARITRYNRTLKAVFKMASLTAITNDTPFKKYYEHLISKGIFSHNARNCVARLIAKTVLAVMKKGIKYDEKIVEQKTGN